MIGIDEVGRGAWAGPLLVVAARKRQRLSDGLYDSKQLSRKSRVALIKSIESACDIGCGWVDNKEIDRLGLTRAMKLAVARSLVAIDARAAEIITMDGNINYCEPKFTNVTCIVRADQTEAIVSAASIYAKVMRDQYMSHISNQFPGYGFESHVGYGTSKHKAALELHGITSIHRQSYRPIQALL